ncbi:MAG: hypothetical protein HUU10_07210 [Bacteroidetes bacterium]|nr:hypothetical protein [Bacteroidota bacterium]
MKIAGILLVTSLLISCSNHTDSNLIYGKWATVKTEMMVHNADDVNEFEWNNPIEKAPGYLIINNDGSSKSGMYEESMVQSTYKFKDSTMIFYSHYFVPMSEYTVLRLDSAYLIIESKDMDRMRHYLVRVK